MTMWNSKIAIIVSIIPKITEDDKNYLSVTSFVQ